MDATPMPRSERSGERTLGASAVGEPATRSRPWRRSGATTSSRPSRRSCWLIVVTLLLMVLVRGFVVQSFFVPSGSMEPTLAPGDRILVLKLAPASSVHRGDVVVFDGTSIFAQRVADPASAGLIGRAVFSLEAALSLPTDESDYVKRVVGMPGDRVRCCDASGRLQVNGGPVDEPYVMTGNTPSDVRFDVIVPPGRLWVMGDHRADSADSRSHLGDPGGGMVPLDDVIGRPILVYWPLQHAGSLTPGSTLAGLPRVATR